MVVNLRADITSEAFNEVSCPDGTSASPYYQDWRHCYRRRRQTGVDYGRVQLRILIRRNAKISLAECLYCIVETVRSGTDNLDKMFTVL